jgi:hypothetical protein
MHGRDDLIVRVRLHEDAGDPVVDELRRAGVTGGDDR